MLFHVATPSLGGQLMFGIKIYMPWNNLGCLGFQVGDRFYMDFYIRPAWACYFRIGESRYT